VEVEIRTEENRAILTFKGDVTAPDLAALQETVNELLQQGVRHFTLNLDAVQYVDSDGLGQLVQLYAAVMNVGGDVKLARLSKRLADLLHLTKLLEDAEKEDVFTELPDPFGARLPMLNPVIWLALLVTLAILVTIASRVAFSPW
jgi:anti-sigma B factor antagonist